jgi:adenine-specific DNA-methyltransferase
MARLIALKPDRAAGAHARKARGAFFTPPPIAEYLVQWAIRHQSDTILEPSCGDASFLVEAVRRLRALGASASAPGTTPGSAPGTVSGPVQLTGTDIDAPSVESARARMEELGVTADLSVRDFFDVKSPHRFSAVIGNPPYVRYQAFTGAARFKGLEAALAQGVRLSKLASSWAAFVVHAASFLTPEGRLALVLPAELLTVNYAAPVRRYLMQRFARVRLVLFEERVFPGVLEEVVLLLAEGRGPTDHCDLLQTRNVSTLTAIDGEKWTPADAEDKWVTGLLPRQAASIYAELAKGSGFSPLQTWGETNLGMVTGNNRYFTLTADEVRELGLKSGELMKICPPGSRHLRGLGFGDKAWQDMLDDGAPGYLFDPAVKHQSKAALAYIAQGEKNDVHEAYKCRKRSPWWKVPRVSAPDAFLTYMNHDTPRIVTNRAGLRYLNSIHGITFSAQHRQLAMDVLPIAALNTVTLLGAELVGRAYGGGLLKLEPKEADKLPVPSRATVDAVESRLRAIRGDVATALRKGELLNVVNIVDDVLAPQLKLTPSDLEQLRAARATLFGRRVKRSKLIDTSTGSSEE